MKALRFPFFCLLFVTPLRAADPVPSAPPQTVRLLTIGNSFADDSTRYLGKMAAAGGGELIYYPLNLSGHSMGQHAAYLRTSETDPANPLGRPYRDPAKPGGKISLPQALAAEKWDYVTIQQVSTKSFNAKSYEPSAGKLIAAIRRYAPQAEILILETWAYRQDHALFQGGDLDQQTMYERLHDAYRQLADRYALRVVPIGTAFQTARQNPLWQFTYPDPNFDYAKPPAGSLPEQKGSLNVGWRWIKLSPTGKPAFSLDAIHANTAGSFLAAATLYEVLFRRNVEANPFLPSGLSEAEATALRKIAHEAVGGMAKTPGLAQN